MTVLLLLAPLAGLVVSNVLADHLFNHRN